MSPAEMNDDQIDQAFESLVAGIDEESDVPSIMHLEGDRIIFSWSRTTSLFLRKTVEGILEDGVYAQLRPTWTVCEEAEEESDFTRLARMESNQVFHDGAMAILEGLEQGWVLVEEAPTWVMVLNSIRLSILKAADVSPEQTQAFFEEDTLPSMMYQICLVTGESLVEILNG